LYGRELSFFTRFGNVKVMSLVLAVWGSSLIWPGAVFFYAFRQCKSDEPGFGCVGFFSYMAGSCLFLRVSAM
ncbi:hypothetical protein, partial [Secundilactobacillus pentosiphilus]|uniref:hypothetical protein n=1 Tax=Secundilactobacillus pentosiphilus TaxID=1714682 RepID=UPI001CDB4168